MKARIVSTPPGNPRNSGQPITSLRLQCIGAKLIHLMQYAEYNLT